jgi:outer membrane protein OmpA-like peptidoglycan-associated protein
MKIKKHVAVTSLVLGLTIFTLDGCTTDPYTGQTTIARTGIGAGVGAAGGALLGQMIGHNTTSTLVGAGIGAAVGGLAGGYMDHQAAELRAQLRGSGVSVVKQGNNIQLVMPGDITFAFNSPDIKSQFYNVLNSVALVLKKYNKTTVQVAGYTDNVGTDAYNQTLSQQRAQSVANYLMNQGVASNRFAIVGYGKSNPVASNSDAAGRAQNRRVTITLIPMQ